MSQLPPNDGSNGKDPRQHSGVPPVPGVPAPPSSGSDASQQNSAVPPPPGFGQQNQQSPFGQQNQQPFGQQNHQQNQPFQPNALFQPNAPFQPNQQNQPFQQYSQQQPNQQPSAFAQDNSPTQAYGTAPLFGAQPTGSPWQSQQNQPGQPFQPAQQNQPEKKKSRLGLILGISIPVAVLAIAGVVAALVVPGMIRDNEAKEAAASFVEDREKWQDTFSEDALAPYSTVDVDLIMSVWDDGVDPTETTAHCEALAELKTGATDFSAKPPKLKTIEGGESNAEYAKATVLANSEKSAYEASQKFSTVATEQLEVVAKICEFSIKSAEQHTLYDGRYVNELVPLLTLANGATETWEQTSSITTFTCSDTDGCVTFLDMTKRKTYGDLWGEIYGTWNEEYSALVTDTCPTEALADLCAAESKYSADSAATQRLIGEAMATDDPKSHSVTGDFDPIPAVTLAIDEHYALQDTNQVAYDDALAALGEPSYFDAYESALTEAANALSDAAKNSAP